MNICGLRGWRPTLGLILLLAMAGVGCDTYYIPPPAVTITLTSPYTSLAITTTDSTTGEPVPSTMQLVPTVGNTNNLNVIYYVGQLGSYVEGGNAVYGYVSSTGVYTAPAVLPNPNDITVEAVPQADTTQSAVVAFTLLNPSATLTSVTPDVVTAGETYTLDLVGQNFDPGPTVVLSGAQLGPVQYISQTEVKVSATIQSSGLLSASVVNIDPYTNTNTLPIRSQPSSPPASSSIAVLVGTVPVSTGGTAPATKAYIPESSTVAVVNLDTNAQTDSVSMPSGFTATLAAANPANNQVVVASSSGNTLQLLSDGNDQIEQALTATPVTTTTTVEGATCGICAMVVDSARNLAILDTANGYFALNLADGTSTTPLAAPAAANFGYDPTTERIYAPYNSTSGSGVNLIDLIAGTVTPVQPGNGVLYGTAPDTAAFNPNTALLTLGDSSSGSYLDLNFNNPTTSGGATVAPATPFTITSGCTGTWNGVTLDFSTHLGWFANLGACVAVAAMNPGPASGAPGQPASMQWAQMPSGPDGLSWTNSPLGTPHSLAVYVGPDGRSYGLALRGDSALLMKMDLAYLAMATAVPGGADVNQVDPTMVTVNGTTFAAFTYISLY